MPIFKSESANKTQQNNAKILFGSKGVAVLTKLEGYAKEKVLDTAGIDALLDVLKTKDTALLQKFADSKTGKTLAKNCKQLASAKTFTAIMKNVKQIKVLKSFDKFGAVPSKAPVSKRSTNVKDFDGILNSLYEKDWEEQTALFNTMLGTNVKEAGIADDSADEGLYFIMKDGNAAYFVKKTASKRFFQKLGVAKPVDLIYIDTLDEDGPYSGSPDILPGTLMTATNASQLSKLFKTFIGWAKKGTPKASLGSPIPNVVIKPIQGATGKSSASPAQVRKALDKATYYFKHRGTTYLFDSKGKRVARNVTALSPSQLKGLTRLPLRNVKVVPQK